MIFKSYVTGIKLLKMISCEIANTKNTRFDSILQEECIRTVIDTVMD